MLFQTWMTYFLLHNIKAGILNTVYNEAALVTSDFHCMNKKTEMFLKWSSFMLGHCTLNI